MRISLACKRSQQICSLSSSNGTRNCHLLSPVVAELNSMPSWLSIEMRTNHAGEFGAVQIYNGAYMGLKIHGQLNIWIDGEDEKNNLLNFQNVHHNITSTPTHTLDYPIDHALDFVSRHKKAEQLHLAKIETLTSKFHKTSLLPLWYVCGYLLGLLPSICGPRALYWTVAAVETFVEEHYQSQITRLVETGDKLPLLRNMLETLCEDEVHHKDEAFRALLLNPEKRNETHYNYMHFPEKTWLINLWTYIVDKGSRVAVKLSKRY